MYRHTNAITIELPPLGVVSLYRFLCAGKQRRNGHGRVHPRKHASQSMAPTHSNHLNMSNFQRPEKSCPEINIKIRRNTIDWLRHFGKEQCDNKTVAVGRAQTLCLVHHLAIMCNKDNRIKR